MISNDLHAFLREINNPLMWAHYACGFNGIAFEYDLDDRKYDIRNISYSGAPKVSLANLNSICKREKSPQDIAILKSKSSCWKYENEYRLYSESEYVNEKPRSVILGFKNSKYDSVIKSIALKYNLGIGYLHPGDSGYEVSYQEAMKLPNKQR